MPSNFLKLSVNSVVKKIQATLWNPHTQYHISYISSPLLLELERGIVTKVGISREFQEKWASLPSLTIHSFLHSINTCQEQLLCDWHYSRNWETKILNLKTSFPPIVQHRNIYSKLCDNLYRKRIWKRIDLYVYLIRCAVFLKPTQYYKSAILQYNFCLKKFYFLTAGQVNLELRIIWNWGSNTHTFESPTLQPQILLISSVREMRHSVRGSQKQILQMSSST